MTFSLIPVDQQGGSILSNLFNLDPPIQFVSAAAPTITLASDPTAATCYSGNTNSACQIGDPVELTATLTSNGWRMLSVTFYRDGSSQCVDTDGADGWTCSTTLAGGAADDFYGRLEYDDPFDPPNTYFVNSNTITLYLNLPATAPTVTDPTTPVIKEYAGTGTFGITWNVADVNGNLDWMAVDDADGGYIYSSSSDFYDSGVTGNSDSMVTTWNLNAFLGTKTYRGRVYDTGSLYDTSADVVVTIEDTTNPVVTSTPSNFNCEYAASGTCTVGNWVATDLLASQYKIQRKTGSGGAYADVRSLTTWVSGNSYTFDHPKNLAIGNIYYYKAYFVDTSTNFAWSTETLVTQQDTTTPTQTANPATPSNVEYNPTGSTTLSFWTGNDELPSQYRIMRDFNSGGYVELVTWTAWTSSTQQVTYDHPNNLALGTYKYRVEWKDTTGNTYTSTSAEITVNQQDTTNPVVTVAQNDIGVEYASSGSTTLSWTATDYLADDYQIEREFDGGGYAVIVAYGNGWTSGVATTYEHSDSLAIGTYNYKITFKDTTPNTIQDIAVVTQQDTTNPVVTVAQNDINVEYASSGSTQLSWTATDLLADDYQIEREFDGGGYAVIVAYGNGWTSGVATTYDHSDNLVLGTYNYKITFKDTTPNTIQDIAVVTHQDTTNPVVTVNPSDFSQEYNSSLTTELIAHYELDNDTKDTTGSHDATNSGVSFVSGSIGNGGQFTASENDKFTIPYNSAFDVNVDFSISFYIQATSLDTQAGLFIHRTSNSISQFSIRIWQTSGAIIWNYVGEDLEWHGVTTSAGLITTTEINHISLTYDRAGGVIKVYKNGAWIEDLALTSPIKSDTNTEDIVIGVDAGYNIYFNGFMDEIYFHSRALNLLEINDLYNAPDISWTATDLLADDYQIEREFDGGGYAVIVEYSNGWTSGVAITYEHPDEMALGTYNYRITFKDTTGNTIQDIVVITQQDTTNPVVTIAQNDISVEYASSGTTQLSWTTTDLLADDYQIERQLDGGGYSVIVAYGNGWTSGVAITYDHPDNSALGTYDYRITFKDTTPNTVQDTAVITQIAGEAPTFTQTPNNVTYIHGNTSTINAQWSFFDNGNISLEWQLYYNNITYTGDGTDMTGWTGLGVFSEIPYLTPTVKTLTYDVGSLTEDTYFIIRVIDEAGYINLNEISVLISPQIIVQPFNIEGHDTDLEMYLPFDGDVLDYSLSGNDATNEGATFVTGQYGNAVNLTTSSATSIDLPNANFPHLNTSFTWAFWMYVDQNPSTYQIIITRQGSPTTLRLTLLSNGRIEMTTKNDAGSTSFSATPSIPLGEWFHIVYTWDGTGTRNIYKNGEIWDTHTHTGTYNNPTTAFMLGYPNINGFDGKLDDFRYYSSIKNEYFIRQLYQEGSPLGDHSSVDEKSKLVFSVYDNSLNGTWNLYRNDTILKENQIWNTTLLFYDITENGTLLDGFYNWTLIAWDDTTPTINTTIIYLIPYSTIAPNIYISPQNATYSNILGNKLAWSVIENHPQIYRLYRNGTNILNEKYTEGVLITTYLNNLSVGVHNFTITFIDNANRSDSHTVWITLVVDQDAPIITNSPDDSRFAWNANNSYLYFSITDLSNGTWEIQRNGTIADSGSFSAGNYIIGANISIGYDISATNTIFNFTIVITDYFGNEISDQIWVFFDDDLTSPQLLAIPDDVNMVNGTTGNIIKWAWFDAFPNYYDITVNGQLISDYQIWSNEDWIYLNIDYLAAGSYTITITVYDTTYDTNVDSVNVLVTAP